MTQLDTALEQMRQVEQALESGAVAAPLTLISDVRRVIWQLCDIQRRMEKVQREKA